MAYDKLNRHFHNSSDKSAIVKGPVYKRIDADLRARIAGGEWLAGAMIPSRKELAEHYGVDLNTLQKAIANLLADGTVQARGRWGTFVGASDVGPATISTISSSRTQSLRTSVDRPQILGIIDEQINYSGSHYTSDLIVERILESVERGFAAVSGATLYAFHHYGERPRSLRESAEVLLRRHVDALLIVSYHYHAQSRAETIEVAKQSPVPVVIISSEDIGVPIPCVFYDNVFAGFQAGEHLLLAGHRSIAFVSDTGKHWEEARLQGVRKALDQVGLDSVTLHVWESMDESASLESRAEQAILTNLPLSNDVTGVIMSNGASAVAAHRALTSMGRPPGDDVALVGFDDQPIMRAMGITAVRPPLEAIGEEAARLVISALAGNPAPGQSRMNSYIIPRQSTIPVLQG